MSTTEMSNDVFHEGELAVQQRADASAQGRNSGRMIADAIIPGAIKFVKKQPLLVVGSVDADDGLWASIVVGEPGFMEAEPRDVEIDLSRTLQAPSDPLWKNIEHNPQVGLLVIDLRTRARLRVNGNVDFRAADRMHIAVEQAYPNCPQYIQRRNVRIDAGRIDSSADCSNTGSKLTESQQDWIAEADTLFVASAHPSRGVDASHRGGHPGFIQVVGPSELRIPDYSGNGMFNTLGNFHVNPRAGLVIPDFEDGKTLQLTGRAEIVWDQDDSTNETGGTGRYWSFKIDRWIENENSLPGSFEFLDYSPHNPQREPN